MHHDKDARGVTISDLVNYPMGEPVNEPVNRTDKVLLAIRKYGNFTRQQLADHLGLSMATLRREIATLTSQNRIRRVGSDKNGYWEVVE